MNQDEEIKLTENSKRVLQKRYLAKNHNGEATEKPKDIKPFEMRPDLYIKGKYSYLSVLFS